MSLIKMRSSKEGAGRGIGGDINDLYVKFEGLAGYLRGAVQ